METNWDDGKDVLVVAFLNFLRGMETFGEPVRLPNFKGFLNFLRGMETQTK